MRDIVTPSEQGFDNSIVVMYAGNMYSGFIQEIDQKFATGFMDGHETIMTVNIRSTYAQASEGELMRIADSTLKGLIERADKIGDEKTSGLLTAALVLFEL